MTPTHLVDRVLDPLRRLGWWRALAAIGALYATGYWAPGSPLPEVAPWGVLVQGVIFGSSYALLAMGLILIHRSTRIVNFAFGAMGAVPGSVTVGLFVGRGVNWFLAIVAGVAVGFATGALVDLVVIRRFASSSRLVLTVASIGLAQVLGAIGIGIGIALGTDLFSGDVQTPLSGSVFIRPYPVRGDHLLLLVVAPLCMAALAWFLLRTRTGVAVRAAAENRDRARLLGIPVARLQTITWAVAGGLATISYVTRVPFTGVIPDGIVGITTILPGLAAAVLARFHSLPAAFGAGLGIGIVEWTIRWNVDATSVFNVAFLVVILVALLLQRHELTRAETGETSWDAAGLLRPAPSAVARLRSFRSARLAVGMTVAVIAVLAPLAAGPSTEVLMAFGVVWAMIGLSLVVLTGWGGNLSLGQFAIVGTGAMAAGNVYERWNGDFLLACMAGIVAGGAVALVLGLPALRIRGFYLAVTTLAFAVALDSYFLNPVNFRGSVPERIVRPVLFERFDTAEPAVTYAVCLLCLVAVAGILVSLRHRRSGRILRATRDNDRSAAAFGVPLTKTRIQAFVLSGCIAGFAGALYITVLGGIGLGTFRPNMSIDVFSFSVIGGISSVGGAISGIALFRMVDYLVAEHVAGSAAAIIRLTLSGTGLLVVLYLLPGGLWQVVQRLRDRWFRVDDDDPIGDEGRGAAGDATDLAEAVGDGLDQVATRRGRDRLVGAAR